MKVLGTVLMVLAVAAVIAYADMTYDDNLFAVGHWQGILTGQRDPGIHYIYVFQANDTSYSYMTNIADDDDFQNPQWIAHEYFDGKGTVYFTSPYQDPTIGKYAMDEYTQTFQLAVSDPGMPIPSSPYDTSARFCANMSRLYNVGYCDGCYADPI
mmetsp:Transcript_11033/g.45032  ORF Transcript_11033/g.45032 Transcript_11033/m.45032 type:complete len:155 (-) Transcript_11033:98-562(-)